MATNDPVHDLTTHHLLEIREPGEVLMELRKELAHPYHVDSGLVEYAQKGVTFEECLGRIGARLDIALDGEYDVVQLMSVLITALRNKRNGVNIAAQLAPGLIDAELEEREGDVTLVEKQIPAQPSLVLDDGLPIPPKKEQH